MDSERWNRISDLFDAVCELPADERSAYLHDACAGDEALYQEVVSLLEADVEVHSMLDGVALDAIDVLDDLSYEGRQVGPYLVLSQLGVGGMGAVYLAERADGQFEQQVALKLIKRGMDSEQILRRFHAERQILARLQHPNIARLLDGGVTENGQPYFAMEYVDGQRIDRYCDAHRLSVDERLDLFSTVCKAVHYAHQNLVVHRDLKPDNILVTNDGRVKLLDFGIAKVLEAGEEGATLTRAGARVMTPEYASPEQVRGEAVNTSTDIYSLGVVLYELLAGHRPFVLASRTPAELERVICSTEPQRPSTVVGRTTETLDRREEDTPAPDTISRARRTEVRRLRKRLTGDLDTICLKALRKEPERRYASVEQFLGDIRRHLSGLPVLARPDSIGYRTRKFLQRHRVGVATTATVAVAFLALAGFYTMRLAQERDRAQVEAEKARQVADFLQGVFTTSDPSEARGSTITAQELLDKGAEKIQEELVDQPEVQASMMRVIGNVYLGLGLFDQARPMLEQALERHQALYGELHEDVATSQMNYAVLLQDLGDVEAAEPLFRQALATRRRLLGDEHADISEGLNHLAYLLETNGEYASAERLYREALALDRKLLEPDDPEVAASMQKLAKLLRQMENYEEAETLLREALDIQRRHYGDEHPDVAGTMRNLASLLRDKGELKEAETLYRDALAMRRKLLGNDHPEVAITLNSLALLLDKKGDADGAIEATREFIAILERIHDEPHPSLAAAYSNLAFLMRDQGRYEEAASLFRQSMEVQRHILGEDHPNRAFPMIGLASVYMEQENYRQAEPLLREALALRQAALPPGHRYIADAAVSLGTCLTALQRYPEAEPLLLESHASLLDGRGSDDTRTRRAVRRLVDLYDAWAKPEKAAEYRALLPEEE